MKYPTTRFVFDRKNTATKKKSALIQVEVLLSGKKKYITTGVKVYKGEWNERSHVIGRNDSIDLNDRIETIKSVIDNHIKDLIKKQTAFDWDSFARFLESINTKHITFIDYINNRIKQRTDIRDSTKKNHKKIPSSLMEFGKITTFEELTKQNIAEYYDWLLRREITKINKDGTERKVLMSDSTACSYMKILRTYIHDAISHDLIDNDPSIGIKVRRGEYQNVRWLSVDEVHKIEQAEMPNGSLTRVRDLFIFMCYSGLAFSDMMDFSPEKIEKEGDYTYLYGKRKKTGNEYIVLVLPQIQALLDKYNYNMPKYSNQQFNHRLKEVVKAAGIDKPVSSHWGRHTAAMMFLNNGIRIETVAKILGHSSTKITEQVYASILKKTVAEEMKSLIK
jgi:site-specific recombinase XerD